MRYHPDPSLEETVSTLIRSLNLTHIPPGHVRCIRSSGSKSRHTLARIHTLSIPLQTGLALRPHYVIEVVSENFDPLPPEEKTKTLIHELLHIPRSFGGGFRHHRSHVNRRTIEAAYQALTRSQKKEKRRFPWR